MNYRANQADMIKFERLLELIDFINANLRVVRLLTMPIDHPSDRDKKNQSRKPIGSIRVVGI